MSFQKLSLVLFLAACGGGGSNNPPPPDAGDPGPDAPPDGPVLPAGCDYAELSDATNDYLASMTGIPEATNLTFTAATVLCGKLDSGHFMPGMNPGEPGLVDLDAYTVTVGADATVLMTLAGTGAEALTQVQMAVLDEADDAVSFGTIFGDHAVVATVLPAGTYTFVVVAVNADATAAPIDYKLKIGADMPDVRCPKVAAAEDHVEAGDGAQNRNNDMVDVRFTQDPAMNLVNTALAGDTPEATGVVTAAGTNYRFSGSIADVNAADEYRDRDTYLFETGPDTNQLAIRLNWDGATSDHDFFVFTVDPADPTKALFPEVPGGTGLLIGDSEPEFATFSVKPSTKYWVWTGAFDTLADGATAPTLPAAYNLSVCAESFTP
jgi:hypothetical protein